MSTKSAAQLRMWRAVQAGKLIPSSECQECGKTPLPTKNGRRAIQGHHHNGYEDALDVIWLCPSCHKLAHRYTASEETKRRMSVANKGRVLNLSPEDRAKKAESCRIQAPWKARWGA